MAEVALGPGKRRNRKTGFQVSGKTTNQELAPFLVEQLGGGVTLVQPLEEGSSSGFPFPQDNAFSTHSGKV